jgi:hypothetical protein
MAEEQWKQSLQQTARVENAGLLLPNDELLVKLGTKKATNEGSAEDKENGHSNALSKDNDDEVLLEQEISVDEVECPRAAGAIVMYIGEEVNCLNLGIYDDILECLQKVHIAGVLHCDIRIQNVMKFSLPFFTDDKEEKNSSYQFQTGTKKRNPNIG